MNDTTADRLAIIQLVNHFGIAIDLRDWAHFKSLFADTVDFDYSSIGEVAATLHPDDITNTARKDLGGFQTTQHVITNHIVHLEGDKPNGMPSLRANCQAHVRAMHFLPVEGESMLEMGGYYEAELIRSDKPNGMTSLRHWKIKSWKFTILWSRGNEQLFELSKKTPNDAYQ